MRPISTSFERRSRRRRCTSSTFRRTCEPSFYDTDAAVRQKAVDVSKKWIDVAVAVGSPGVRPHINGSKTSKPDVDRAAESLRKLADYAAEKNVVVTLENDDPDTEDAFFIAKVIDAVNQPYLRALPDFANSVLKGDLDFNYRAMKEMFARAYNISHVKDGEADDNGKILNIDIKKTFEIAKAANLSRILLDGVRRSG